jgi:hypothetical protein
MSDDDYDSRPVGFLGKLRNAKVLTWVLIIGLLALTVGGTTIAFLIGLLRF